MIRQDVVKGQEKGFVARALVVLALCVSAGVQVACEKRGDSSIVIVAVDSLHSHQILCGKDLDTQRQAGFAELCQSALRFTHAMTPSPLSVPALASVLTGLYPYEHGVRHNGDRGLASEKTTFAEAALAHSYRTSFWSGGPPMFQKSGLDQGFEVFDDHVPLSSGRLYRPFDKTISLFEGWLDSEAGDASFASVFYVPDLSFTDNATESENGEQRSLSFESQLEEFDENLGRLIKILKKKKRWDQTTFIVLGLNGREMNPRPGEIEPLLLNSENTQVALFVKPPTKPRDQAVQWNVDRNVTLVDVGRSLFDLAGAEPGAKNGVQNPASWDDEAPFPVVSLTKAFTSANLDWDEDRPLLIESAWGAWQMGLPVRGAVLRGHRLTIDGPKPRQYNMLTDRLEMNVTVFQSPDDPVVAPDIGLLRKVGIERWTGIPDEERAVFEIPPLTWISPLFEQELLNRLRVRALDKRGSPRALRWAAAIALDRKDWTTLQALGKKRPSEAWTYVAERNLRPNAAIPPPADPCLRLFVPGPVARSWKDCPDEAIRRLSDWIESDPGKAEGENAKRRAIRDHEQEVTRGRLLRTNAALGLIWLPLEEEKSIPSNLTLALALPEMKKWRGLLSGR